MFTLHEIKEAHMKVASGADFPRYVQDLRDLGVAAYSTFVSDGHTGYLGKDGFHLQSEARYAPQEIGEQSDVEGFAQKLKLHQQGESNYPTFCRQCAESGVEKWTVDLAGMTCTYYDRAGNTMLTEKIPQPA